WLALLMVPLLILGIVPLFGPMKKAELAARGGALQIDAEPEDMNSSPDAFARQAMEEEFEGADRQHGKLHNFLLPLALLVAFTIWFDTDIWPALLLTFAVTLPMYMVQKLMNFNDMMDQMMHGFKSMLPAICTVIAAFTFKDVCDQLGLP